MSYLNGFSFSFLSFRFSLSTYLIYYSNLHLRTHLQHFLSVLQLINFKIITRLQARLQIYIFVIHIFTITPSSLFTAVNLFLAALIVLIGIIAMYSRSFYWLLNIGYVSLLDVFSVDKIENRKNKIFSIWILSRFCLKISFVRTYNLLGARICFFLDPLGHFKKIVPICWYSTSQQQRKSPYFQTILTPLKISFIWWACWILAIAIHSHYSI